MHFTPPPKDPIRAKSKFLEHKTQQNMLSAMRNSVFHQCNLPGMVEFRINSSQVTVGGRITTHVQTDASEISLHLQPACKQLKYGCFLFCNYSDCIFLKPRNCNYLEQHHNGRSIFFSFLPLHAVKHIVSLLAAKKKGNICA